MNQPRLARIDQSKLRETVYDALKGAFTRGEFAPDVLSLRDLADQLGCSPTPVREAVGCLVAEGALIDTPSRTLMVPPFDARRISDLKAARLALESLTLRAAMDRARPQDLAGLETLLAEAETSPLRPNLERNYAFHFALYDRRRSDLARAWPVLRRGQAGEHAGRRGRPDRRLQGRDRGRGGSLR